MNKAASPFPPSLFFLIGWLLCGALAAGEPAKVPVLDERVLRWLPSAGLVGGSSFDGSMRALGEQSVAGKVGRGFRMGNGGPYALRDAAGKATGDWDKEQAFSVALWAKLDDNVSNLHPLVSRVDGDNRWRGWGLDAYPREGFIALEMVHSWADNALKVMTPKGSMGRGQWHHIVITYDGSASAKGVAFYVDSISQEKRVERESLTKTIRTSVDTLVGSRSRDRHMAQGLTADEVRLYDRVLEPIEILRLARLVPGRPVGRGATVRVSLDGKAVLSLAEVKVLVARHNVAPAGQATQSKTSNSAGASRAIDGNTDGRFDYGSVTHTPQHGTDPWWKVDLAFPAAIEQVVLWNRWGDGGDLGSRLNNAKVEVLDMKGRVLWEGKVPTPAPRKIVFDVGLVDLDGLDVK